MDVIENVRKNVLEFWVVLMLDYASSVLYNMLEIIVLYFDKVKIIRYYQLNFRKFYKRVYPNNKDKKVKVGR